MGQLGWGVYTVGGEPLLKAAIWRTTPAARAAMPILILYSPKDFQCRTENDEISLDLR